MMCPVKSRNGNSLGAEKQSCRVEKALGPFFFVICREKAADEMKFENTFVFCVLVILTGSSQTRGQSSAAMPPETLTSPDPTEDPDHEVPQWTHIPAGQEDASTQTTITKTEVHLETVKSTAFQTSTAGYTLATSQHTEVPVSMTAHNATSSAPDPADSLSSTPTVESSTPTQHISTTEGRALLTTEPLTNFSSLPAHTTHGTSSTAHTSTTQQQSESLTTSSTKPTTTGLPLTSAPGRAPAGPTHQEVPSELNVGDEDHKSPRSSSPLDPLLAGLLSVFIVTTAIVFVVLFLKFRQRTNHPEFHRLQDLPMDDLMEDTPLSRYSY